MKTINNEMDEAIVELGLAQERLMVASSHVYRARKDETECINRVNAAQKRIDEIVDRLRKQAPRETDWKRAPSLPVQT